MKKIFSILGVIFIIGFGMELGQSMPKNQILLFKETTGEYFAPPCLMQTGYNSIESIQHFAKENNLVIITNGSIPPKSHPNNDCREESAFYQEGRSVTGTLLEWIGILPKQKTKWNANGTWNSI